MKRKEGRVRIWLCLWSNIYHLRSRKPHINPNSFRLLCFLTIILTVITMLPLNIMTKPHFPYWEQDWTLKELSLITNQTRLPFSEGKREASVQPQTNYCKKLCTSGEVLTACLQWDLNAATGLYYAIGPDQIFSPIQES